MINLFYLTWAQHNQGKLMWSLDVWRPLVPIIHLSIRQQLPQITSKPLGKFRQPSMKWLLDGPVSKIFKKFNQELWLQWRKKRNKINIFSSKPFCLVQKQDCPIYYKLSKTWPPGSLVSFSFNYEYIRKHTYKLSWQSLQDSFEIIRHTWLLGDHRPRLFKYLIRQKHGRQGKRLTLFILYNEKTKNIFLSKTTGLIWKEFITNGPSLTHYPYCAN